MNILSKSAHCFRYTLPMKCALRVLLFGLLLSGLPASAVLTNVVVGTAGSGAGDPLHTAFTKVNSNMVYLETQVQAAGANATNLTALASNALRSLSISISNLSLSISNSLQTNINAIGSPTSGVSLATVQASLTSGTNDAALDSLSASNLTLYGDVNATSITTSNLVGNGSGLTNLSASNISSGTLSDSRLSPVLQQMANYNGSQLTNLNGAKIQNSTVETNALSPGAYAALVGGGGGISAATAEAIVVNSAASGTNTFDGTHTGDGSGLTGFGTGSINWPSPIDEMLNTNIALLFMGDSRCRADGGATGLGTFATSLLTNSFFNGRVTAYTNLGTDGSPLYRTNVYGAPNDYWYGTTTDSWGMLSQWTNYGRAWAEARVAEGKTVYAICVSGANVMYPIGGDSANLTEFADNYRWLMTNMISVGVRPCVSTIAPRADTEMLQAGAIVDLWQQSRNDWLRTSLPRYWYVCADLEDLFLNPYDLTINRDAIHPTFERYVEQAYKFNDVFHRGPYLTDDVYSKAKSSFEVSVPFARSFDMPRTNTGSLRYGRWKYGGFSWHKDGRTNVAFIDMDYSTNPRSANRGSIVGELDTAEVKVKIDELNQNADDTNTWVTLARAKATYGNTAVPDATGTNYVINTALGMWASGLYATNTVAITNILGSGGRYMPVYPNGAARTLMWPTNWLSTTNGWIAAPITIGGEGGTNYVTTLYTSNYANISGMVNGTNKHFAISSGRWPW